MAACSWVRIQNNLLRIAVSTAMATSDASMPAFTAADAKPVAALVAGFSV